MASIPPHPPVPKPRINKPHPPPSTQSHLDTPAKSPIPRSPDSLSSSSEDPSPTPVQPPLPAIRKPSIGQEHEEDNSSLITTPPETPTSAASNYEEPVSIKQQILLLSANSNLIKKDESQSEDDEDDEESPYTDIDAGRRRHSDYINWECLQSDEDGSDYEDENSSLQVRGGSKYAPSIKLHSHPALKKSQSNSESDMPLSMVELLKVAKKPKNRAPPPPPGVHKDEVTGKPVEDKLSGTGGINKAVTKHKRSHSDANVCNGSSSKTPIGAEGRGKPYQTSPLAERKRVAPPGEKKVSAAQSPSTHVYNKRPSNQASRSPNQVKRSPKQERKSPSQDKRPAAPAAPAKSHGQSSGGSGAVKKTPPLGRAKPPQQNNPHKQQQQQQQQQQQSRSERPVGSSSVTSKPKNPIPSRPPPPSAPAPVLIKERGKGNQNQVPQTRHINAWGEEKGIPSRQPPAPPTTTFDKSHHQEHKSRDQEHKSRDQEHKSRDQEHKSRDQEHSPSSANTTPNIKPKRHAPPPPAGGTKSPNSSPGMTRKVVPEYATVMKNQKPRLSSNSIDSVEPSAPPKPSRVHKSPSMECLSNSSERESSVGNSMDAYEDVLKTMDLFTVEITKEADEDIGLVIVNGKIRSGCGLMAEGVFIKQVIPGSVADQDGRIQAGDMLITIFSYEVREVKFEETLRLLEQPSVSIRVKVARPDITSSVFSTNGDKEEAIYVNQIFGPAHQEVLEKLEKYRMKASEFERDKELAIKELESARIEAQREREALKKELEDVKESLNQHRREAEEKTSELTVTLASVSVGKTKAENDLECHKEKLEVVKKQLEEEKLRAETELEAIRKDLMDTQAKLKAHDTGNSQNHQLIQNLREELTKQKEETSKMSTELANEKDTVSELLRKLKVAEQVKKALNDRLQNTIDEQALQISALKLEVDKLRQDLEVANSRVKELEIEQSNAHIQSILPPPPKRDEKPRFSSPEPVADVRPESPLSEEDLQIRENGEVSSDNKSDSEEEMFDEHSPSPVVPCPYIDFVPLQLDPKRSTKDKAESKPEQVEESGTKKEEEEEAVKEFSVEEREDEKDDENDISETTESASSPPNEDELQSKRKELEAPADIDSPMPSSEHETTSDSVTSPEVKETPLVEDHVTDKVEDKAEDKQEDKAEGEQEEEEEEAEGKTKGKEEEGKPEGDDIQGETENNKPELTEVTAEDQPSGIDPYADFDAIKPHKVLNTSAAVFRSRMGGTIKRKLPSRSHLKKMSSSDDILNNIPKDVLTKLDRALDDSSLPQPSSKEHTPVPQSVPPEEVKETRSTPVPQPKPKPRAAPRKKPQPTPPANLEEPKDEKKPPQAAPRSRMSHDSTDPPKLVKELRPETEKVAKEGEISSMEAAVDKPKEETTSADSDNVPQSAAKPPFRPPQVGPKPSPKRDSGIPPTKDPVEVNPKPSPKREIGKPPAKDPTEVNSVLSDDPALPARSRTGSSEKDTAAPPDLSQKDPSKLTIKEKALLAQKMLSSTPEKIKPGPPVPRKPKPAVATPEPPSDAPPVGVSSTERMKRTQSMDDDLGASPQNQRKKLPPGAFNMMMMGGVSVFGPGAADRGRSATVSTTDPVARERNSLERDMHLRANSPRVEESTIQEESRGVDSVDGPSAESEAKTPHADLMPPVKMASLDEDGPEFDSEAVNEPPSVDTSVQPSANGASDEATSAANVDYNLVLTWTPDVTAAWLSKVGLGSYQQVFVERGVQGYMLFDLDGHALKGMGISSHDDRNLFKKEIKNLKPFADKQKKIIEKQRKEEKKLAKKKKK